MNNTSYENLVHQTGLKEWSNNLCFFLISNFEMMLPNSLTAMGTPEVILETHAK